MYEFLNDELERVNLSDQETIRAAMRDAFLFLRALGFCDCGKESDKDLLWQKIVAIANASHGKFNDYCEGRKKCLGFNSQTSMSIGFNFSKLVVENPDLITAGSGHFEQMTKLYLSGWARTYDDLIEDEDYDVGGPMRRLCRDVGFTFGVDPYRDCRTQYPYSDDVMMAMRAIVARYLVERQRSERCELMNGRFKQLKRELFFQPALGSLAKKIQTTLCSSEK